METTSPGEDRAPHYNHDLPAGAALASAALSTALVAAASFAYALCSIALPINPGTGLIALLASMLGGIAAMIMGVLARRRGKDARATLGSVLGALVAVLSVLFVLYITPVQVISSGA